MPDAKVPDAKKKGKQKGKIFGLPWYVVAGGVVAAIALGLYLRSRSSSGASGTTAAPAQDTTGAGGSGGGSTAPTDSGTAPGVDLTGLQGSIDNLAMLLGSYQGPIGGDTGGGGAGATGPTFQSDVNGQYYVDPTGNLQPVGSPIGTFWLGQGIYGDPTSPAQVGALNALTNYWRGLGSPTQVSQLHPSKTPVQYPQAPAQHGTPQIGPQHVTPNPLGINLHPNLPPSLPTQQGKIVLQVRQNQSPAQKGLGSKNLF
jgi:hypothetical protein